MLGRGFPVSRYVEFRAYPATASLEIGIHILVPEEVVVGLHCKAVHRLNAAHEYDLMLVGIRSISARHCVGHNRGISEGLIELADKFANR